MQFTLDKGHFITDDKMKKQTIAGLLALSLMLAVAGCGKTTESKKADSKTENTQEAETRKLDIQDRSGNDITLPEEVKTIISMSPATTRVLIDMGVAEKIVAADTNSQASYGDKLGKDVEYFDMMQPDQEKIAALAPDIMFTSGMSSKEGEDAFANVRTAGVCVADIPSSTSIKGIEEDITFLGYCLDMEDEAEKLVKEMDEEIAKIEAIAKTIPEEEKKTVLFELYTPSADNPTIYTAGQGTYIQEMLEKVGVENVAAKEEGQWPALTEEAAVGMNPDVILTADMYTPDVINVLLKMKGWENVSAIKDEAVYQINADDVNQPNHHIVDAMKAIAKSVYPDYFKE
ncbi:iron complex transport system substrate-binding protein [Lachnospiraceae bacterium XBB1006]|nr:iron complex transport system substrate-binding protein [Lachnospiraceae bacterium XBB1006]